MQIKKVILVLGILSIAVIAYAAKITEYAELDDHIDSTDVILTVDISDTSMDATGTTKKIERHNLFKYDVVHKTTSFSVTADDTGTIFTNSGATEDVTASIEECTASTEGNWWVFYVMDTTYEYYVDPNANNSIADFSPGEDGEHIYGDKIVGSAVKCVCMKGDDGTYDIYTMGYIGTWTTED